MRPAATGCTRWSKTRSRTSRWITSSASQGSNQALSRTSPVCEDCHFAGSGLHSRGGAMTGRRRGTWLLGAVALAAGISMMVAAYGVAATRTHAAPKQTHAKIGTLRAVLDTIDFLDPQQAYTGQSWWAMWNVYETLLTYKHVDGPAGYSLVPGLAQSLPKISSNGRVYKFTLRKGLKYSNGKPVLASDFKWAIKRGFLATGQGVGFYTDIAGADAPDQAGEAARGLPDDPRTDLRGTGACEHVDGDPERHDPGNGPVPLLE